ncbi:hypothetical protein FA15DRAFT_701808 [Coprinopsis marcescibilis]|uniref:Galectin n=1 Tax=Coprinopsis marcescibilis TaxID=230819 RepID=A0A5C3L464_COPMA|nr:hypothetical protein FA15DRAFT_701808 [Coprinopsis marcescibilis]
MSTFINLQQTVPLPFALRNGGVVEFLSPEVNAQSTALTNIHLLNGREDVALVISFRPAKNTIVFNSKTRDGEWGQEQQVDYNDVFRNNSQAIVSILDLGGAFSITFNRMEPHVYPKEIWEPVGFVRYEASGGDNVSLFSPTLVVRDRRQTLPLQEAFAEGGLLQVFSSVVNKDSKVFTNLNFLGPNYEVVRVVAFRPGYDMIVFNSKDTDGRWLVEHRVGYDNAFKNSNAIVKIFNPQDTFEILIDRKTPSEIDAMVFYLLQGNVGGVTLQDEFKAAGIMIIQAPILDASAPHGESSINLLSKGMNCLLRITFRQGSNDIAFNSCPKAGSWGNEEHVSFDGRFGVKPRITVYDHGDRFQIIFDNTTAIYYNKRIREDTKTVSYSIESDKTVVFGEQLGINTYSGFGEISPI